MKQGLGTSGYHGYKIELTIVLPEESPAWAEIERHISGPWRNRNGARSTDFEYGCHATELAIFPMVWKAVGRYCEIYIESREMIVKTGDYFSTDPEDFDLYLAERSLAKKSNPGCSV